MEKKIKAVARYSCFCCNYGDVCCRCTSDTGKAGTVRSCNYGVNIACDGSRICRISYVNRCIGISGGTGNRNVRGIFYIK